jgi:uncharacterized protein with HEPN domain
MYSVSHKDYACLLNMLDAAEKIQTYVTPFKTADDFFANVQAFDAVLMNFVVLGEMVDKISEQLKDSAVSNVDWYKIKGFRNVLAHDYFGVDAEEVWQIIHGHIPSLQREIQGILG